jgi:glucosamine 6-phosphate synthetase-like amidotransferase/phosphosugar isomerase protein
MKDEKNIERLLVHDYWRGKDSTGFAAVRKSDDAIKLAKIASHPFDLFDSARFKAACSGAFSKAFIGHNRAATKGVVNGYNAHPFVRGHIVGAHNGTLSPSSHKALEDALEEKFSVDSEAIFAGIEKFGIEETMKMCQGAWALVWYDTEKKKMFWLRNEDRPFWYAYSEDFKKVFWASEYWMLDATADSEGLKFAVMEKDDKRYRFFQTEENRLYEFDLDLLAGATERYKPKIKEVKGKVPEKAVSNPFPRETGQDSYTMGAATTPTTTTSRRKVDRFPNVRMLNFVGSEKSPYAGVITESDFNHWAQRGCAWCGCPIEHGDKGITIFEKDCLVFCNEHGPNSNEDAVRIYVPDIKLYQ